MKHVPTAGSPATDGLADMNGVLAYWGPPVRVVRNADQRPSHLSPATDETGDALHALATTLNGRTWSGTHALMSRRFDGVDARETAAGVGRRRDRRPTGAWSGIVAPAA